MFRLAMYQSLSSGFRFCVCTRIEDAVDVAHIEKTIGCTFVKWIN